LLGSFTEVFEKLHSNVFMSQSDHFSKNPDRRGRKLFPDSLSSNSYRSGKVIDEKNALLWFALARDGFGGWAIVNLRLGIEAASEDEARAKFLKVAQAVLRF
jgi:hypothetical protein